MKYSIIYKIIIRFMIKKIYFCPLCKSDNFFFHSYPKRNIYSEFLSKITNLNEEIILKKFANLKCKNCDLLFKDHWFNDNILIKLYSKFVPIHPRGWDVVDNIFSKKIFLDLITEISNTEKNNNNANLSKLKRKIKSIINSISNNKKDKKLFKKIGLENKYDDELDINKLVKYKKELVDKIDLPQPFSRFNGFADNDLLNYYNEKIKINSYGEIGCPLWGFLNNKLTKDIKKYYLNRLEPNYWSYKCKKNNNSLEVIQNKKRFIIKDNIKIINFDHEQNDKINLIGIYQYLDHIFDPLIFFKNLLKIGSNFSFILDNYETEEGLFIQHFTGWNNKSFKWMCNYFNKNFANDFDKIKDSGNSVYLVYDK